MATTSEGLKDLMATRSIERPIESLTGAIHGTERIALARPLSTMSFVLALLAALAAATDMAVTMAASCSAWSP